MAEELFENKMADDVNRNDDSVNKGMQNVSADEKKDFLHISLLVIMAAFSYCVFAPVEYYFANKHEVWYDLYNILPLVLIAFLGTAIVLCILGRVLVHRKRALNIFGCAVISLSICLYIQGNFIIVPYETMNGEAIDWSKYSGYNLSSVMAWAGITALCTLMFVKCWKNGKALKVASVLMICVVLNQLFTLTVSGIQCKGFSAKKELVATTEGKWNYSDTNNMFILLLDTMDSRVFENMLQMYDSDYTRQSINYTFNDFTFFRDTMGAFSLTDYSIPQILTGEMYLSDEPYFDYIEKAYDKSPFLNKLKAENWNINIHAYSRMPQLGGADGISNLQLVDYKITDYSKLFQMVYGLVNFRYFPTPLKQYVFCDASDLGYTFDVASIGGQPYIRDKWYDKGVDLFWDNDLFYYGMMDMNADCSQNVMQFYHLKGIHATRDVDYKFRVIDDPKDYYTLEQETTVVVNLINRWIYSLKENGVYDNSTIVIMGDHGSVNYGSVYNYGQSPVLMVKGRNEHHDFMISDVPLSYMDLQDVFIGLADGKNSSEVAGAVLDTEGLSVSDFAQYDLNEFIDELNKTDKVYGPTGRRRSMIFHIYEGALGGKNQGGNGYELYTDFPTSDGAKIDATGVIY